jgi:hypothetical protein
MGIILRVSIPSITLENPYQKKIYSIIVIVFFMYIFGSVSGIYVPPSLVGTFDPDALATATIAVGALVGSDQSISCAYSKDSCQTGWSFAHRSSGSLYPLTSADSAAAETEMAMPAAAAWAAAPTAAVETPMAAGAVTEALPATETVPALLEGGVGVVTPLMAKDVAMRGLNVKADSSMKDAGLSSALMDPEEGKGVGGEEAVGSKGVVGISKRQKATRQRVKQVIMQTLDSAAHWEDHISKVRSQVWGVGFKGGEHEGRGWGKGERVPNGCLALHGTLLLLP